MLLCSDANIWFDFCDIGHIEHPFLLDDNLYICRSTFDDEIKEPNDLRDKLIRLGLNITPASNDEFLSAQAYIERHKGLSLYDALAICMTKVRGWVLFTGDRAMVKAAAAEGVEVHGTLWVYDRLLDTGKISKAAYHHAMADLQAAVIEGKCRFPPDELKRRLER